MPYELIIIAVLVVFVLLLIIGQSIASTLLTSGLIGVVLWRDSRVLDAIVGPDIFFAVSTYSLSIIPLYLFMAQLLMRGGVVADLFTVGIRVCRGKRFPLGVATIASGGMLGAVSGSGSAAAATLATLASPQLEQIGYSKRYSVALCAVAGSLSAIVPPSIIMIIYGSITSVPVGELFIGSLVPALICILSFSIVLYFFPETHAVEVISDNLTQHESIQTSTSGALVASVFVVVLMIIVFGGIYGGLVTASEAGALGAFIALLGLWILRKLSWGDVRASLVEASKVTAMLMMIVVGAQIFGRFLAYAKIPNMLMDLFTPLMAMPELLIVVLLGFFFIFGLFLESAAVMILLLPVIMPILTKLEVDLLWFGIVACFTISMGLLTPPVGLATYSAAMSAGIEPDQVFRVTTLFASIAALIVAGSLILWPGLATVFLS
ncbi:C4-dicarboxylate ABC transporter [Kineobactrum sediminis]|uniref:C4-dicarboxylate ABC transporter n=1 Tax=Kineobactrum sediminis TaxID=1905677 RepID=A0A2N5Y0Y4_9GAMM|nr:TRAP transporter large permease subunit [Kineobactrum sediminis]PLW82053.1 C4-dicarboxylate ABC transporter [Kineobactrum sediminis]